MGTKDSILQNGVYFYYHEEQFDPSGKHHASYCLATGLRRLGISVYSKFRAEPFDVEQYEAARERFVVFDLTEGAYRANLTQTIANHPGVNKVVLCMGDMSNHVITPVNVLSLVTHQNRFLTYRGRRRPWAFGLSDFMLRETRFVPDYAKRERTILRNFRPSFAQSIRNCLDLSFVPHLEKHFTIDRDISNDHFAKLKRYIGCLAYGGHFAENLGRNDYFASNKEYQYQAQYFSYKKEPIVVRWDSWRFWESLAAGCVTLHLDFEKYGLELPVMPTAWEHYVPIDLEEPARAAEQMMERMGDMEDISRSGRSWARKHYSPTAVAKRFLKLVVEE